MASLEFKAAIELLDKIIAEHHPLRIALVNMIHS